MNATPSRSVVVGADAVAPVTGIDGGWLRTLPPWAVLIEALHAGAAALVMFPRAIGMLFADPATGAMAVHQSSVAVPLSVSAPRQGSAV